MFKKLMLLTVLLLTSAFAQECQQSYEIATSATAGPIIDNRNRGCQLWNFVYWIEGFTAITVRLEYSIDQQNWTATSLSLTDVPVGKGNVRLYAPYFRVYVVSATGSGKIKYIVGGYKGNYGLTDVVAGGSGGGSYQPLDDELTTLSGKTLLGTGANLRFSTGTPATNDCAKFDANGNIVSAGAACGTGGTGFVPFAPTVEDDGVGGTNNRLRLACSSFPYCSIQVNGVVAYTTSSDITATLTGSSSTGNLYVYYNPETQTLYCDENTSATNTVSGCSAATTGGIPAGSVPFGRVTGTYAFASNSFSDPSTTISGNPRTITALDCTPNLNCSTDPATGIISLDISNLVPTKVDVQNGALTLCSSSSASSPYTCSPDITSLTAGMTLQLLPTAAALSGTVNVNVNSIGNIALKKSDGSTNPASGDLAVGRQVPIVYDGTVFRLPPNPAPVTGGGAQIIPTTIAALPGSCTEGNLYLPTDSLYTGIYCGASNAKTYFYDGKAVTPPSIYSATWYWVNQSTATDTTTYGYNGLVVPTSHTGGHAVRATAAPTPGASASRIFAIRITGPRKSNSTTNSLGVMIGFKATASTTDDKLHGLYCLFSNGTDNNNVLCYLRRYSTATGYDGDETAATHLQFFSSATVKYVKIQDDNTNLIFSISEDGRYFSQIASIGRTSWIAGGPAAIFYSATSGSQIGPTILDVIGIDAI